MQVREAEGCRRGEGRRQLFRSRRPRQRLLRSAEAPRQHRGGEQHLRMTRVRRDHASRQPQEWQERRPLPLGSRVGKGEAEPDEHRSEPIWIKPGRKVLFLQPEDTRPLGLRLACLCEARGGHGEQRDRVIGRIGPLRQVRPSDHGARERSVSLGHEQLVRIRCLAGEPLQGQQGVGEAGIDRQSVREVLRCVLQVPVIEGEPAERHLAVRFKFRIALHLTALPRPRPVMRQVAVSWDTTTLLAHGWKCASGPPGRAGAGAGPCSCCSCSPTSAPTKLRSASRSALTWTCRLSWPRPRAGNLHVRPGPGPG
jgi:hypothetical protein